MFSLSAENADIVLAGDSLIQRANWDELLPEYEVINRGIGSDTSEGLLNRIDEVLLHHPKIIVIMIGINDIGKDVCLQNTINNMESICETIMESDSKIKVALLSVLPTITTDKELICNMNIEYEKIAKNFDRVEFINCYNDFFVNGKLYESLFSDDGVHLMGKGYKLITEKIKNYLLVNSTNQW